MCWHLAFAFDLLTPDSCQLVDSLFLWLLRNGKITHINRMETNCWKKDIDNVNNSTFIYLLKSCHGILLDFISIRRWLLLFVFFFSPFRSWIEWIRSHLNSSTLERFFSLFPRDSIFFSTKVRCLHFSVFALSYLPQLLRKLTLAFPFDSCFSMTCTNSIEFFLNEIAFKRVFAPMSMEKVFFSSFI